MSSLSFSSVRNVSGECQCHSVDENSCWCYCYPTNKHVEVTATEEQRRCQHSIKRLSKETSCPKPSIVQCKLETNANKNSGNDSPPFNQRNKTPLFLVEKMNRHYFIGGWHPRSRPRESGLILNKVHLLE